MDTYIVAEIASNWEGSISKAKNLILKSKKNWCKRSEISDVACQ